MMWLLKEELENPQAPGVDDSLDARDERPIKCRACGHAITSHDAKTSVHGAYEHRRVNPTGVDFHLGCFSRAPGCAIEGAPTLFWTWFPGYAWQIALCRGCGDHLGWAFTGESTFFGLILPRLTD